MITIDLFPNRRIEKKNNKKYVRVGKVYKEKNRRRREDYKCHLFRDPTKHEQSSSTISRPSSGATFVLPSPLISCSIICNLFLYSGVLFLATNSSQVGYCASGIFFISRDKDPEDISDIDLSRALHLGSRRESCQGSDIFGLTLVT